MKGWSRQARKCTTVSKSSVALYLYDIDELSSLVRFPCFSLEFGFENLTSASSM